jgi:hypothetical protein
MKAADWSYNVDCGAFVKLEAQMEEALKESSNEQL